VERGKVLTSRSLGTLTPNTIRGKGGKQLYEKRRNTTSGFGGGTKQGWTKTGEKNIGEKVLWRTKLKGIDHNSWAREEAYRSNGDLSNN